MLGNDFFALTGRALRKWIRNPAAVMPGFFMALFFLVLFGNSLNPTSLIPTNFGGFHPTAAQLAMIKIDLLAQYFSSAPTYISFLTAGIICLILVFNMGFGGIDLVLDRQNGFLNTLLSAPISRASIFFSGVVQNILKVLSLAFITFIIALILPNGLELGSGFGILDFLGVFGTFILLAFGISCVFTALALSVKSIDSLIAIVNFATFPLIFASTALFPQAGSPIWLLDISDVNPISKASDAARLLMINGGNLTSTQLNAFGLDIAYLVAFTVAVTVLGYLAARKALAPK
jgi:ABC-2 type transport system permease protein